MLFVSLIASPASAGDADNQNATISDETLVEETAPPATEEEVLPDEPIISEPETPDTVGDEPEEAQVITEDTAAPTEEQETPETVEDPVSIEPIQDPEQIEPEPKAAEVIEETDTCPAEEPACPVEEDSEEEAVCTVEDEQEAGCSDDGVTDEECSVVEEGECSEPVEEDQPCSGDKDPAVSAGCSTKKASIVSNSGCSKDPAPEKTCDKKTGPSKTCSIVKPKPSCSEPSGESESSCPAVEDSGCPGTVEPVEPELDEGCPLDDEPEIVEEPEDPIVIPEDPELEPVEPPVVTPEDPIEEDQDKITTVRLCRNNVCTVGAAGDVLSITNYASAKDPTYAELLAFLMSDKTDEKRYTSTYMCGDYAKTLHDNAEKAGIRAGWVGNYNCEHAFNVFRTTDKGLIYIDCTGQPNGGTYLDKQLNVEEGKPLTGKYLFKNNITLNMGCVTGNLLVYW